MSRLIIHIGLHKTGSTAIQNVLGRARNELLQEGIIYPSFEREFYHHGLVNPWITLPKVYSFSDPAKAWKELAELAKSDQTVIVSSEEFSRLRESAVNYQEVRELTQAFDDVTIVLVLRHQLQYIQSIYLEVSKNANVGAFSPFLTGSVQSGYCTGLALDYGLVLDHLEQGFSPSEIRVLSYDGLSASSRGFVRTFLACLGVFPHSAAESLHSVKANVSSDPLAVWMANIFDAPSIVSQETVKQWARALRCQWGARQQLIFTRSEADFLCQHYAQANEAFVRRVEGKNHDFTMPVEYRSDQAIYREDVTPDIWRAVHAILQNTDGTAQG